VDRAVHRLTVQELRNVFSNWRWVTVHRFERGSDNVCSLCLTLCVIVNSQKALNLRWQQQEHNCTIESACYWTDCWISVK